MKLAQYYILFSVIIVSCKESKPHETKSDYFNSLLNSATIHTIDIDTLTSDTLYFKDSNTYCINGFLGELGLLPVGDMHLFNDSLNIVTDPSTSIVWAIDISGYPTEIAGRGYGPGEVQIPQLINSLSDTLFILDSQFIHAFDKNLRFMYRFPHRSYPSPLSKFMVNSTLYLSQASINEPGARFNVYDRNKDSLVLKRSIFDLVIDPENAVHYRLSFNSVIASLSKYNNTLLFYYYSSPYVFISDENGTISGILRLESPELLAAEPMYSEVDYLQGDQQNTGQGDFIPDPEKMSKFSTKMTDFQFLENGDIRFIYKDRFLITIANIDGKYRLANKKVFSYIQNKQEDLYITNIFRRNNGSYTGFSRSKQCIVNS